MIDYARIVGVLDAAGYLEMVFTSILCFIVCFANAVYASEDSFVGK